MSVITNSSESSQVDFYNPLVFSNKIMKIFLSFPSRFIQSSCLKKSTLHYRKSKAEKFVLSSELGKVAH